MWLVLSILAFNFIIIVHECGHFFVAKCFGIKVIEFSLFFGPKIFSFQKGETTYSLRMIPVLAYVKLEGEEESVDSENSFSNKPLWQRALVIFAGPASNIIIACIIYMIVLSVSGFATNDIGTVEKNSAGEKAGILVEDKIIRYNGYSVFQPMDVYLFMYASKGIPANVEFERNGEIKTAVIKPTIIKGDRYIIGIHPKSTFGKDSNIINGFTDSSPAESKGIKSGDRITALDNTAISSYSDISEYMNKNKGDAIKVVVERKEGKRISNKTFLVEPYHLVDDDSYDIGLYFVGVEGGNILSAIGQSFIHTYDMTRIGAYSIAWLFQGKVPIKDMAGPVGAVAMMNDVATQGEDVVSQILNLLNMTALVSIGLGVANLLPIPIADGGRLILYIIEAIRRKPISKDVESYINMVGFLIVIFLFVFVMYNDIARLILGG